MFGRQIISPLLAAVVVVLSTVDARPQTAPGPPVVHPNATRPRRALPFGILTERLSPRDLRKWRAIERQVLLETGSGAPLYPVLRGLWDKVNNSGHAVFIEIAQATRLSSCTAGNFRIETLDPTGKRHVGVIWLNLENIDQAFVGPSSANSSGFIPFVDLTRDERYAEVLGHELAHAADIFETLERTKQVEELVQRTNDLLLTTVSRAPVSNFDLHLQIRRRDALLRQLERVAEQKEEEIWLEIIAARNRPPASGK